MERDHGNLFVLEGLLISLILLGAAYTVTTLDDSSVVAARPRSELGRLTTDVLRVLEGLEDNGTSLLDLYLVQALHCATDASPSTDDCEKGRGKNLSLKLDNYLPLGAGYAIGIGNGFANREIYHSPLPRGESVGQSVALGPEWNLTFVSTDLTCYEAGQDITVTLIPIDKSRLTWTRWGNVTVGSTETAAVASSTPLWYGATLPAATRAASGTIVANVTANASLPGATAYTQCNLNGQGPALVAAIGSASFSATAAKALLGAKIGFDADITDVAAVPGVTITAVNVSIYEPLPPSGLRPDTWVFAGRVPLTGTTSRTGEWEVPPTTLYGAHPVVLRVGVSIGGTNVELRRVMTLDVGLPTGEIPIDPPYWIYLQTWLADWG